MRNARALVALCLLAVPAVAVAEDPPFDPAIDVQTFDYAIGPKTFITVADAEGAAKQQLAVDALLTYLTKPFSVYDYDPMTGQVGGERTAVVSSLAAMQLTAAYGIDDKLQVGALLPVIFQLAGDGLTPKTGDAAMTPLNVTGLGDLVLEGKYRLYRENGLHVAGLASVSLPTSFGSDGSQFIGDNLPTLGARVAAQYDVTPRLAVGVNSGALLRKSRTIYKTTVGPQFLWGAAAAVRVTDRFSLVAEGFGRVGLPDGSLDESPLEVEGGLRVYATSALAVVAGGGAGVMRGIGAPQSRFFLSIGYSPDVRDSDGDGIPNGRDRCPFAAEDRDGVQDEDGCPDDDNDGDHRPDTEDRCPTQAEDLDGFEDDDGCPDPDNDKDGIPDLEDKCPNDREDGAAPSSKDGCPAGKRDSDGDGMYDDVDKCPLQEEDTDGFEDGDGCPDLDNDNDGVPDATDKCPMCPEDKDGFQDDDGCPDLDNDSDGIPDTADRCPLQAETLNGVTDDDGCPDTGGLEVARLDGDRLMIDRVPALSGGALSTAGNLIVDQMALVILAHPEVTKWLVAVAQPSGDAAKKLADAVKARLVAKGVPAARVDVLGAAGTAKIGGVVQERGEVNACPKAP